VTVTSDRFAGGNELISATFQNTMAGDIVGTGTGTQDTEAHADTSANIQGMFTCTCTVAGRSGTFVVKYAGTCPPLPGPCTGNESIGHGTGELATLHGQGTFAELPTGGVLKSWKLHFDPS
jgi:hypothetical protein